MTEIRLNNSSRKRKPARVKLKTMAQAANVSVATVSMALSDHPGIGTETKRRIWQLSAEMGYQPKNRANVGSRRMLKDVGFMWLGTKPEELHDGSVLHEVMVACGKADIRLQVAAVEMEDLASAPARSLAMAKNTDGLLLMNYVAIDTMGALNVARVPFVVLGYSMASSRETMEAHAQIISTDDQTMGQTATESLLAAGHKRIAFVCETMPRGLSHWRYYNGYVIAHSDAGVEVDKRLLYMAGKPYADADGLAEGLTKMNPAPTAYVVPDARIGGNLISAMKRRGTPIVNDAIVVGADPAIVGLHGLAEYARVEPDHHSLVEAALRQLQLVFEDRSMPASTVQVPFNVRNLPKPQGS